MRTNFSPHFLFGPGSSAAGGATPWGAIAQGAVGLAQTIGGWIQQHKATKELEKLKSPSYSQNQSILDFYSKALQKYNLSPYSTASYKKNTQDIGRNTTQGLDALRGRGGSVAGVNNLVATGNDSLLKASADAENRKAQEFSTLGTATQMKAGEDRMAFNINQQQPFERKYNLLAMKAAGGNQVANSGISNVFGGLQNITNMDMLNKMYSDNEGGGEWWKNRPKYKRP